MSVAPDRLHVLVVGAGIVGLSCAWRLRERGHRVTLWSRDDPLDTVSAVAGAIWYPYLAEPRERVLGWSAATFRQLAAFAQQPGSGVTMRPVVEVFEGPATTPWWAPAVPSFEILPREQVPAPFGGALRVDVPVVDVPVHLPWLVARLAGRSVRIERRAIQGFDEAFAVADTVVNCTGLGAASLCGDRELVPVRGQVLVARGEPLPHAWIDDTAAAPAYVIPRGDTTVLGGTAQTGDARTDVDEHDSAAILARLARSVPGLGAFEVERVKVGLRPYRSTVRLEREELPGGRRLVHAYGHGGSGYTLSWGTADEVTASVARGD